MQYHGQVQYHHEMNPSLSTQPVHQQFIDVFYLRTLVDMLVFPKTIHLPMVGVQTLAMPGQFFMVTMVS